MMQALLKEVDNAKILMMGLVGLLLLINVGIIAHMLIFDGATAVSTLDFLEKELEWLIPTSGVVSVIQHGVTALVNRKGETTA